VRPCAEKKMGGSKTKITPEQGRWSVANQKRGRLPGKRKLVRGWRGDTPTLKKKKKKREDAFPGGGSGKTSLKIRQGSVVFGKRRFGSPKQQLKQEKAYHEGTGRGTKIL